MEEFMYILTQNNVNHDRMFVRHMKQVSWSTVKVTFKEKGLSGELLHALRDFDITWHKCLSVSGAKLRWTIL
jgi:hypothetical protein